MAELKDKMFPIWYVLWLGQDKLSILWDDINTQETGHEWAWGITSIYSCVNYMNAGSWTVRIKQEE